jgi:hypothetical protein
MVVPQSLGATRPHKFIEIGKEKKMNTKTIEHNPFELMVVPEMATKTDTHLALEFPITIPALNENTSIEYGVRQILDQTERFSNQEQSLIPHHVGEGVVFSGTVVVSYRKYDMVTIPLSEDPLYTQRDRFPIPRKVLNHLRNLQKMSVDFDTLYIVHEIPKDTLRSGDPLPLDLVDPPPSPENMEQAERIGNLSRITWMSTLAPAVPVVGVPLVAVSVPVVATVDPILFGLKIQENPQPKILPVADWFYLCRWSW